MSPTMPLVDASIASAIIAPDPLSYITVSDEKEKGKSGDNKQQDDTTAASSDQKPRSKKKTPPQPPSQQQQEAPPTTDQRYYAADSAKIEKLRKDKPWARGESSTSASSLGPQHPQRSGSGSGASAAPARPMAKNFESLSLSPSAVTKIMMHCQSGVEKGISKGGNPIEGT